MTTLDDATLFGCATASRRGGATGCERTPFIADPDLDILDPNVMMDMTAAKANTHVFGHAGHILALEEDTSHTCSTEVSTRGGCGSRDGVAARTAGVDRRGRDSRCGETTCGESDGALLRHGFRVFRAVHAVRCRRTGRRVARALRGGGASTLNVTPCGPDREAEIEMTSEIQRLLDR